MRRVFLIPVLGILISWFSGSLVAQVDVPNPPQGLSIKTNENLDGTFDANLSWFINNNNFAPFPHGFHIYQTIFQKNIVSTQLLDEISAKQGVYQYSYVVKNLKPGTYEFYVTSFIGKAESRPSNTVRVVLEKHEPFIKIISQPPIYAFVGVKYLYQIQVHSNINCPIDEFGIDGTPPKGMTISKKGLVEWVPQDVGEYEVTVRAGTSCKINIEPARQTFKIIVNKQGHNDQSYIRIVSKPPTKGIVGVPIYYQVVAESNVRCPIKFKLTDGNMDGAVIDENTGLLTWSPKEVGQFGCVVVAYLSCDTNIVAIQKLCIEIQAAQEHPKHCVHLVGSAKFADDTPVSNGLVYAWKLDANDNQTNVVFKTFIKHGVFEFYLPVGTYVFEFYGEMFEHVFYHNAKRFVDAVRIKFECIDNETIEKTLEVVLPEKPKPIFYTVSGYVNSMKDDAPILALVEFIPVEFLNYPEKRINYGAFSNFVAKTDKDGHYEILLPNTFSYIAHAIPLNKEEFYDQYYQLSSSPYLADIIELKNDRGDINFRLKPIEKPNNGFTGIVVDKDRNPIQSRVLAILVRPKFQNNIPKDAIINVVETNENGYFRFVNLIPGDYVLLSIPKDKHFAPGYYKMNDFATLSWKEATIITVDDVMIQMIFEIKHRERLQLKGLVRIEGQLFDVTGLAKQDNKPQCDEIPLDQALVAAMNIDGNVIEYFVTGKDGKFILEELPPTTFKIFVTKVGYKELEATYSGDYESNFAIRSNFYLQKEVSEVQEGGEYAINLNENNLILSFDDGLELRNVRIFDVFGNSLPIQIFANEKILSIDISSYPSGVYFANIITTKGILQTKFVIVR